MQSTITFLAVFRPCRPYKLCTGKNSDDAAGCATTEINLSTHTVASQWSLCASWERRRVTWSFIMGSSLQSESGRCSKCCWSTHPASTANEWGLIARRHLPCTAPWRLQCFPEPGCSSWSTAPGPSRSRHSVPSSAAASSQISPAPTCPYLGRRTARQQVLHQDGNDAWEGIGRNFSMQCLIGPNCCSQVQRTCDMSGKEW